MIKKVYIIARISEDAHAWTDAVCVPLETYGFDVFKPKDHNPWNEKRHKKYSREVFETDLEAMKRSDVGLLLPEYGRDCASEAGWYGGSEKPLVVFVDSQTAWLRDWMVKGWVSAVISTNPATMEVLQNDPILKDVEKVLIDSLDQLGVALWCLLPM